MKKAILYVHGKGGSSQESNRYKDLCPDYDVFGFDYKGNTPWDTKDEFIQEYRKLKNKYIQVYILANSIGAFFTMCALQNENVEKAYFISPILNMEKLILDMMLWSSVTEKELKEKKTIPTNFGENLSYDYLEYVRNNPIKWDIPTEILYAGKDNLTSLDTVNEFVKTSNANLTIMEDGEHWFHTQRQLDFLDKWLLDKLGE